MVRTAALRSCSEFRVHRYLFSGFHVAIRSFNSPARQAGTRSRRCAGPLRRRATSAIRMKLHAADRQGLVLDRHRHTVLGTRPSPEHVGHAVALDADDDSGRSISWAVPHQPPAPHLDPRWRPPAGQAGQRPEIFADRLHAETYAEDRQLPVERAVSMVLQWQILRPAGPGDSTSGSQPFCFSISGRGYAGPRLLTHRPAGNNRQHMDKLSS